MKRLIFWAVFESLPGNQTFRNRTTFKNLNTGLVQYWIPTIQPTWEVLKIKVAERTIEYVFPEGLKMFEKNSFNPRHFDVALRQKHVLLNKVLCSGNLKIVTLGWDSPSLKLLFMLRTVGLLQDLKLAHICFDLRS